MQKETTIPVKSIFIFGLTFLFFSCGQQTENKKTQTKEIDETNYTITEKTQSEITSENQSAETVSTYQQELNKALADTEIDDYFKEVYRQEKLISEDDNKMLSITENLFIDDPDKDLFYFVVFTKSMNGSDGFYSEALGYSSYEFVTTKTEKFADYFNIAPKLTEQDMENWAECVYWELQISSENNKERALEELESLLFQNIETGRKEYRVIMEQFINKIKSTMP